MAAIDPDLRPDDLPELLAAAEERLHEILLERPPAEQAGLLAQLVADYPEAGDAIRLRVELMKTGDRVLERVRQPLAETPLPERIAGYRIESLLGEGGFGSVYRAIQDEPVHRTVALKVLHPLRFDERSMLRFHAERQVLARMQHRNIAQIYDAGSTPEGLHYFAMEFVDGQRITSWCDRHRLTLSARIELFLRVCAAVQHAHQRGVVHRDLTPNNLLVKLEDGQPCVKVIDFGIAKVIEDEVAQPLATREGAMIGTPGYMSPEQAGGRPVDTRTDVYALGVLLYELATGDLPFARRRLMACRAGDIARIVEREEPRRLGTAVRELGDEATRVAMQRGCSHPALLRELRGDLEWVVRKALAKDPEQRYGGVSALIADIERYQRSEPVVAREPEALYLLRRFIARHRLAVALSATFVAATVVAVVTLWWLLAEVDDARRTAVERGDIATRNEYAAHLAAARAALDSGESASARRHLEVAAEQHRGWEWHYLTSLCDTSLAHVPSTLPSDVHSLFWLDDARLFQVHADGTVIGVDLHPPTTKSTVARLATSFQAGLLDAKRERLYAIVDNHRRVLTVDTAYGSRRQLYPLGAPAESDMRSLALSPDQGTLAISDNSGAVTLLDPSFGQPPRLLCTASCYAWSMQFTPDGEALLLGTGDGRLELRAVADGELLGERFVHKEGLKAVALAADARTLFCSGGTKLHKFELVGLQQLQRVEVGFELNRLQLAGDGQRLYGGGAPGGRVMAWSVDTLELAGRYHGQEASTRDLALSPDGRRLAASSAQVTRIWPATPPPSVLQLDAGFDANDLAVSPDGEAFAAISSRGTVRVWNARSCQLELEHICDGMPYGCALTASTVYVGGSALQEQSSGEVSAPALWAIDRVSHAIAVHRGPRSRPSRMCVDTGGQWLLAGSRPWGRLSVWRLPELELVHELELPVSDRMDYDAVSGCFVVAGTDGRLRWLAPASGKIVRELPVDEGPWALAAHAGDVAVGGDRLLVGAAAGSGVLMPFGNATHISAVTFAPDGSRIATCNGQAVVTVWDRQGTELLALDDAPKSVTELCFAAGGERLIGLSQLSGAESFVMVWGVPPP